MSIHSVLVVELISPAYRHVSDPRVPSTPDVGLRRLSTNIGGMLFHGLFPYTPLPTSSSSPSLLGVERQVQSKPEVLFLLCRIHFAPTGPNFTLRWRRAGDNEDRSDDMGGCRLGGAEGGEGVFNGDFWVRCGEESGQEACLVGRRREPLESMDTRGRRIAPVVPRRRCAGCEEADSTTESLIGWSAGGRERTTVAPAFKRPLVNEKGRLDVVQGGIVDWVVRISSICSNVELDR